MLAARKATVSAKATRASRASAVRPVAALSAKQVAAGVAAVASVAAVAAPAHAATVLSTIASASEGYPFVPPSWAPSVLVPFTGLVLPAIAMATLFNYIEADAPQK